MTHPDWIHIGGQVDLPGRFTLGQAIISENVRGHEDTQLWLAALDAEMCRFVGLQQGPGWILVTARRCGYYGRRGEEALRGLDEDDKNERSLVAEAGLR